MPPYYKGTSLNIKTIFDFKQLKSSIYFLNTQYRMPTPLGDFISVEIYNSQLESVHDITDGSCLRFVDVWKGSETSVGSSFKVSKLSASFKMYPLRVIVLILIEHVLEL